MSKGIDFSKMADFSELEKLADRIDMAVTLDDRASKFNKEKILKAGSYKLMNQLLKDTPHGKNRSNWYDWTFSGGEHSASYHLAGRTHKAGTLARGWVTFPYGNPEIGGSATLAAGKIQVDSTIIDKSGDELSMTFYNSAPYAAAVEWGHWVKYPWFWNKESYTRVPGKYYTQRAIWHSEEAVKKAVKKECTEMLKQVVNSK